MSLFSFMADIDSSFLSATIGTELEVKLIPGESKHMGVARIERGKKIILMTGDSLAFIVEYLDGVKDTIKVKPIEILKSEHRFNVTLYQGISKGSRMDDVIRQGCELGLKKIVPLMTKRSIVRLSHDKEELKLRRWQEIAKSAAKQSGQTIITDIGNVLDMKSAILDACSNDVIICAWEDFNKGSIGDALNNCSINSSVAIFIGPEGGFEQTEIDIAKDAGANIVSLGSTILRTETAGVVASALVLYELGGLGRAL